MENPEMPPAAPPLRPVRASRRFAAPRTIFALMLREMSTRYGATPGGYIWAIAAPVGMIAVLSVAFSLLLRSPSLGDSFIVFYSTAYLPFTVYRNVSASVAGSINFSKSLLKFPAVSWVDAILARFFLNSLTTILVSYILLAIVLWATGTRAILDLVPIVTAFGMAMLLGLGTGALNCALFGLFPAWSQIWGIATRPLMIMSAVIYIMEDMPRTTQDILWYNPLVHITGLARSGFYSIYSPSYINLVYVGVWAMVPMLFGFLLLRRYHKDILNR